ncbi:MAG: DUF1559 domain-containing protein [Isosphaeraceae bacterium]
MNLSRARFKVQTMMVAVAILGLILWLAQGLHTGHEVSPRRQCQNNLRQIGLGLIQYSTIGNAFPYAALPNPKLPVERRLSWIVAITPYLDSKDLYNSFDQDAAWDSPSNAHLAIAMGVLRCPEASAGVSVGQSNWVGITGVGSDSPGLPSGHPRAGVFGFDRVTRPSDIKDGVATTLLLAETAAGNGRWTAGGDATVRPVDPAHRPYIGMGRPFGGLHPGGVNVVFADGSVRFLSGTINPRVFEALSTIAGGEPLPIGWDE